MFKTQHVFRNMIIDKSCLTNSNTLRFLNIRVKYPTSIFLKASRVINVKFLLVIYTTTL